MSNTTLNAIQQKVRRITRSPSENQLTTNDLNEYINTFVLYDFPEHLRLFNLRTTLTFYTQPYVDTYSTNTDNVTSPLYDFVNKYITVHQPIFIAGFQAQFFESRTQFYSIYPLLNSIASIGVEGDGSTTAFSGVINAQQANIPNGVTQAVTLLPRNVMFSSIDVNFNGLTMIDTPLTTSNVIGNLSVPNQLPTSTVAKDPINYVNYLTGEFVVTFQTAPGIGQSINSQTVPQNCALPQSLLFFDGKFTVRPVPDQPYSIQMEVYKRPTELLQGNQSPELNEWWQLIVYGASKKVFEDRMDIESVSLILPEYEKQMSLCLRRTIVQQTSQRTSTIYTENNGAANAYGPGFFSGGGSF